MRPVRELLDAGQEAETGVQAMTREKAIEWAASLQDGKFTCDNLLLHRRIAAAAHDAGVLTGLEMAVKILRKYDKDNFGVLAYSGDPILPIRAEIARLKGAGKGAKGK